MKAINSLSSRECEKTANLPHTPKFSLPPETQLIVAVFLDVLSHVIQNPSHDILVMLDHGNMFIGCALLPDRSSNYAFHTYFSHWISYFDAPYFTVVDRGSNLASTVMRENLHSL